MALKINKKLLIAVKLIISSALLYFVFEKAGIEKVLSIITAINPYAFFGAILIYIFSLYISSMRWRLLLPDEFKSQRLFSFYLIGSFFNTFLPGIIGGDAVKTYYLYKETNKGSLSLASVFMDRYIGFIALMGVGFIAFLLGFRYFEDTLIIWLLPAIILSFIAASYIVFGLRFGKKIRILSDFYEYFDSYRNRRDVITKTLLISFIVQILSALSVYVIALGLRQHLELLYFFMFFPVITTISTLPISISGIGVREGSFVVLFGLVGVKAEMATAISFAWFLSMTLGGLAGLVEYLRLRR